jgi:hypothetical protein
MRSPKLRRALLAAALLGPLAALSAVWLPLVAHYYVATPRIAPETVARLQTMPEDALFARLAHVRLGTRPPPGAIRALADEILGGTYRTHGGESLAVPLVPSRKVLTTGSPMAQLELSSLAQVSLLLDAYRETGAAEYLRAALDSALAWARFERAAWLPVGFLWNDHAIAARVVVLADLWRAYRRQPDFDPARGAEILAFVARSATLLARDSHYTARTNHGIMQNLALLHVAALFPGLPDTEGHVAVALERLGRHLPYYVGSSGVVLEHSAGYQDFAIRLLRYALDYLDVLDLPRPHDLQERYEAAQCFRRHFTRPDGSIPGFGDTFRTRPDEPDLPPATSLDCPQLAAPWIDQEFGYASYRDLGVAGAGQLLVTWANFAGGAHKHDDELGMWLWLHGRDWWASAGYWPYGDARRDAAVSWRGANAPHGVGETGGTSRESTLLGFRAAGEVPFLDLERRAAGGQAFRRQIAALGGAVLVLDHATAAPGARKLEIVWTLAPGIAVRATKPGTTYELIDARTGRTLRASFYGGRGHAVQRMRGSSVPYAGLVAVAGEIRPAEALVVTADAGAWAAALWEPEGADGAGEPVWAGPERWSWAVGTGGNVATLERTGSQLTLRDRAGEPRLLPIGAGHGPRPELAAATARYREASARFPVFRDYFEYRARASIVVLALAACQFAALWLVGRFGVTDGTRVALLVLAWSGVAGWLYYGYLA